MGHDEAILRTAEAFLRDDVAPRAQEIDRDVEMVLWALQGLCDRDLMALKRPAEYGGPALSEEAFRHFQEMCARYCGTLSFLQTQHQSAGSMIARSENEALKNDYLPKMANGERLVGIGFSQLRRGGPPVMRATETKGGYVLDGHVPWVTGYGFYPEFLLGATLPDGRALFVVAPLVSTPPFQIVQGSIEGGIRISAPMKLAAMEAANTVTVDFENYFVSDDKVCFIRDAEWIKNNDQINIALQGHFALGCAQAGLDILSSTAEKKKLDFARDAHLQLSRELADCREQTRIAQQGVSQEIATDERLKVRAWAIDLAVRCAHAAVTASSGAANSVDHPAQRVYREALVYTVSAQTVQIMESTLARLVRPAK
jgi:alkylation response protein AidB-like acyl-CoA dehydrogenase